MLPLAGMTRQGCSVAEYVRFKNAWAFSERAFLNSFKAVEPNGRCPDPHHRVTHNAACGPCSEFFFFFSFYIFFFYITTDTRKDEQKHQGKQKSKAQNKTNLWKKGQSGPIVQMKWGKLLSGTPHTMYRVPKNSNGLHLHAQSVHRCKFSRSGHNSKHALMVDQKHEKSCRSSSLGLAVFQVHEVTRTAPRHGKLERYFFSTGAYTGGVHRCQWTP